MNEKLLQCCRYINQCTATSNPFHTQKIDHLIQALWQEILAVALAQKASDIHLDAHSRTTCLRLRIDGILHDIGEIKHSFHEQTVNYIKIMAKMDNSQKLLPQDGHFSQTIGKLTLDMRISSCPSQHGEKCVIRLLPEQRDITTLSELDIPSSFKQAIQKTSGLIVISGPTGSGKTTTNYSAINHINQPSINILTIEDPIEITLPGITQVNINLKAGLSFDVALRAFLRLDPDVIMLGEIRDQPTAELAIKAAQTGHLVLATLHTFSAKACIHRLKQLGVSEHALLSCMPFIINQRLVRLLCPQCKTRVKATQSIQKIIEQADYNQAQGCSHCHQGFSGRKALFETACVHEGAIESTSSTLLQSGIKLIKTATTSWEEIQRVLL
jgi:type II secretory ATPase GspE/PulE/Tfp pilus assembly ATPase PilB-like protein